MARRARFKADLGEAGLRRMVKRFGTESAREVIQEGMPEIQDLYLEKMVQLAPVDTGELESSGQTLPIRNSKRGARGGVEFTAEHAAIVHELPRDARGPKTRDKAGNEFGPAGPKYMERVLRGLKMAQILAQKLREAWAARS